MHSSVIGKIEKANRYARELDRITIDQPVAHLSGRQRHSSRNPRHRPLAVHLSLLREPGHTCAHVLAMQKILGQMLSEPAQTSFFGTPESTLAEPTPA